MSGSGRANRRGEILTLNVTSLIDVCAIIIIFLVLGTFFGESGIDAEKVHLPKTYSKDGLDVAPQVIIRGDVVDIRFLGRQEQTESFLTKKEDRLNPLRLQIKDYLAKANERVKVSDQLLNIVADKSLDYKSVYDVTSFFREVGFQSMLFIAEGN